MIIHTVHHMVGNCCCIYDDKYQEIGESQVFDSSVTRNEPAEFTLEQVIPGWTEALLMMAVGSKWRITVPSDIGYGEAGSPPVIPGGSTLVFEISLLDIVK